MNTELEQYREERPWGNFVRYTNNQASTVKIITVKAGEELSLQYHMKRTEWWKILEGNPTVTVGDTVTEAKAGDEFLIPEKAQHRIAAGDTAVVFLEIALGDFDEADIVRLQDKYGRV